MDELHGMQNFYAVLYPYPIFIHLTPANGPNILLKRGGGRLQSPKHRYSARLIRDRWMLRVKQITVRSACFAALSLQGNLAQVRYGER